MSDTLKPAARKRHPLAPEPMEPMLQAGDNVFVCLPVQIRQVVRGGGFVVSGSGISRTVTYEQLLRLREVPDHVKRAVA